MKLYHSIWSPNCQKVLMTLHELGVAHSVEITTYNPFARREDWFLALNPAHKVPVLVDGDVVLSESGAINLHLANKFGALLPDDPQDRATATMLLFYEACNILPTVGGEGYFGEFFKPEEQRDTAYMQRMLDRLPGRLAVLDGLLSDGRDYFARTFSIGDIQLYSPLRKVEMIEGLAIPSRISAWVDRVAQRPAVRTVYEEVDRMAA